MSNLQDDLYEAERRARDLAAVLKAHPDAEPVDGEIRAASLRPEQCNLHDVEWGPGNVPVLTMRREIGSLSVSLPTVRVDELLWEMLCGTDAEANAAVCRTVTRLLAKEKK